jgi:hypothetical protein
MKALFFIGLAALILGVVSLVVPIPHRERTGVSIGGVSLGLETRHEEKIHPALSVVMILGLVRWPQEREEHERTRAEAGRPDKALAADACFQNHRS